MAEKKYKLDVYLTHVLSQKEEVRTRMAEAERKVQEEKDALAALQDRLDKLTESKKLRQKEYWDGMKAGALTAAEIRSKKHYIESIEAEYRDQRRKYLAQERAIQRAEKALAKVRDEYMEISNEVKVHEELKEKWLRERKREKQRREDRSIEEIGSALHERRRRENRG